ncbi:MAG: hypothetical protein QM632_04640 [Micrococcaceae bacterium]
MKPEYENNVENAMFEWFINAPYGTTLENKDILELFAKLCQENNLDPHSVEVILKAICSENSRTGYQTSIVEDFAALSAKVKVLEDRKKNFIASPNFYSLSASQLLLAIDIFSHHGVEYLPIFAQALGNIDADEILANSKWEEVFPLNKDLFNPKRRWSKAAKKFNVGSNIMLKVYGDVLFSSSVFDLICYEQGLNPVLKDASINLKDNVEERLSLFSIVHYRATNLDSPLNNQVSLSELRVLAGI